MANKYTFTNASISGAIDKKFEKTYNYFVGLVSSALNVLNNKFNGGASNAFVAMPYVGTEPIIESGSNANGSYTKFSDGILEQWGTVSATTSGSLKYLSFIKSLPLAYIDATYNIQATLQTTIGGRVAHIYRASANSVSQIGIIVWSQVDSAFPDGDTGTIMWRTIGKWK